MQTERLPILTFEGLAIDQSAYEVFINGESIPLARIDFEILVELAKRPKLVLSKRDLASLVNCSPKAVTEHVRRVRNAIGTERISTVRSVGYRWDARPVGGTPTFS